MDTLLMYHRGGGKSLGYPPNCLRTLEWAIQNGASGIEYDVVAAKRGEEHTIVMIEPGLVEDRGLNIDDLHWKDIEDIDTGNEKTGGCDVAELTEVLNLVDQSEVKQQIHIKGRNPRTVPTLIDDIGDIRNITITSFDLAVLQRVNDLQPESKSGWIVKPDSNSGSEGTQDLTEAVTSNPESLPSYTNDELRKIQENAKEHDIDTVILCAPKISDREPIKFFKNNGFEVGAWGVGSNLDIAQRMIRLEIDRFTIDNPEELDV